MEVFNETTLEKWTIKASWESEELTETKMMR